ncbi:MAG: hypothetical protein PUB07_03515 [Clostridia bacterium]|nr:hypothetical protein [Clostridia bacterium]
MQTIQRLIQEIGIGAAIFLVVSILFLWIPKLRLVGRILFSIWIGAIMVAVTAGAAAWLTLAGLTTALLVLLFVFFTFVTATLLALLWGIWKTKPVGTVLTMGLVISAVLTAVFSFLR